MALNQSLNQPIERARLSHRSPQHNQTANPKPPRRKTINHQSQNTSTLKHDRQLIHIIINTQKSVFRMDQPKKHHHLFPQQKITRKH